MSDQFQKVHTVLQFEDSPRRGIAEYDGMPHLFASLWNDARTGYDPRMVLTPVAPPLFALAMEDWAIWQRWETAFHAGIVSFESHPALPEDRARSDQLKQLLAQQLVPDPTSWFCVLGTFRTDRSVKWDGKGLGPIEVSWIRLDETIEPDRLVEPTRLPRDLSKSPQRPR